MNTHFHLLVSISSLDTFSSALKWLKWQYTIYFNQRNKRQGPLWRERFKSQLIENEDYLYGCGFYIESNPVEAGIARSAEEWPYSSASYWVSGKPDPLVDSYEHDHVPTDLNTSKPFKGPVIGSDLFKMQFSDLKVSS